MNNNRILLSFILITSFFSCTKNNQENGGAENINVKQEKLFSIIDPSYSGVTFKNTLPESAVMNSLVYEYYYNGGGVAIIDVNNDGLSDLYFTSNLRENKLYLNKGNLQFQDITKKAGVGGKKGWTTGVTVVDINNDGWMDIYVSRSGRFEDNDRRRNELFINKGLINNLPVFEEDAKSYGLDDPAFSTQAAFFDFDLDGDLDMFLLNHNIDVDQSIKIEKVKSVRDPLIGDKLFRNNGDGHFEDISERAGIISNPIGFGLGVSISDLDNDGWPDIYVTNDYSEKDYLYLNQKNGTFKEILEDAIGHISHASMGIDIADINNDGWYDIFVPDMIAEDNYGIKTSISSKSPQIFWDHVQDGFYFQYTSNTVQINQGVAENLAVPIFSEIAQLAGVSNTDWSWGPLLIDFDNDGFKDLFIANGIKRDFINYDFNLYRERRQRQFVDDKSRNLNQVMLELVRLTPTRAKRNYIFKNNGDLTFSNKNTEWGMGSPSFSNGAAYADLDNDGDLDIIVNNVDQEAFIYKNNASDYSKNHFLQIQLSGVPKNPDGIGAKVTIHHGGNMQVQELYLTRGYQSAVDKRLHFGLGNDTIVNRIEVNWPDNNVQILKDIQADQIIHVEYKPSEKEVEPPEDEIKLFTDITKSLNIEYVHAENDFNDFEREGLLPYKYSNLGPGIGVGDVNNDGLDDFFIGGAKGFPGNLFLQKPGGNFILSPIQPWNEHRQSEDIGALFFDAESDGDLDLYTVSGGNEFKIQDIELQDRLYINNGNGDFSYLTESLPKMLISGSMVISQDYDKDGDLDLFIGGRIVPGKYPLPSDSYILRNDTKNGKVIFTNVTTRIAPDLLNIGLITDAVWCDINNDNFQDLIVVGEWMPVTILQNKEGVFTKINQSSSLNDAIGWWQSIAASDFDNDGDQDLVVGNLGLNCKYKASISKPFEVFVNDFDNNGKSDLVFGFHQDGKLFPVRGLTSMSDQMPFIGQKFPKFHDYANATISDIFGEEKLSTSLHYRATTFATSYFENLGDFNFKISSLLNQAQVSVVNDIEVLDFDKDGNNDILISGNLYRLEIETPRLDAGKGLFLKGDGGGSFEPVPAIESGLFLSGDVKESAIIKINKEMVILVGKNSDRIQFVKVN